ncbi:MAG: rhomboid family intramembrane serine protease [Gammaproteobacteria bacterium]|nr:rhomboid family intramembrane serine protease [Gammaproteobacteria bacterium]MBV9621400.1 rhomboid family intramembrane serine protease [Gammaproteobacteria bacterium]
MAEELVTVYGAPRRRACEERLLVLTAVGVPASVSATAGLFVLQVAPGDAAAAQRHLQHYEQENRPAPPPPPPPPVYPYAWVGCVLYAVVLLGVAAALSHGAVRLDAFDVGELDAARVQAGEYWRSLTALTLHLDGPHLAANLLAGVWFGYLAARQMGVGLAWCLTVGGAGLANLLEALAAGPEHRAVGASTAVFTALGAMAAYSWRERLRFPQRWARRWGPLVAGVVLLGWTGTAGEGTDVTAHLAGFSVGVLLGIGVSVPAAQRILQRVPQWLYGALALAALALAWARALAS